MVRHPLTTRLFFLRFRRSERVSASSRPANVYQIPDAGTGKRVSLQPLPDTETTDRNRARPVPDRTPDQDLVPEQADEAEEGTAGRQRDQRTGPQGSGNGTGQEARAHENGRRWRRHASTAAAAAANAVASSDVARTTAQTADGRRRRPGQRVGRYAQGQNVNTCKRARDHFGYNNNSIIIVYLLRA